MNNEVIITGVCGYIGSHTAVEFLRKGYHVIGIDDLSKSNSETVRILRKYADTFKHDGIKCRFDFSRFDLKDTNLRSKTRDYHIPVIHFAAYKSVPESMTFPLMYYHNNLVSLLNVLKIFEGHPIIFSSSAAIYDQDDPIPLIETANLKPCNPYSSTKMISEIILKEYTKYTGIPVISLRYFNPITVTEHGLTDTGETNIFPKLMDCLRNNSTFTVNGINYDTKDGTCVRDYISIDDLVEAHIMSYYYMCSNYSSSPFDRDTAGLRAYNIGTGTGYSVLELIEAVEKVSGLKINYEIGERRRGDIPVLVADPTKAKNELGFDAKFKTIESIIERDLNIKELSKEMMI